MNCVRLYILYIIINYVIDSCVILYIFIYLCIIEHNGVVSPENN